LVIELVLDKQVIDWWLPLTDWMIPLKADLLMVLLNVKLGCKVDGAFEKVE